MAIYIGLNPRVARTMNDITCIKGYSLRPLGSLFPNKKFLNMLLGCVYPISRLRGFWFGFRVRKI